MKDWQRADLKRFYNRDEGFKDGTEVHCELIESLVTRGGRFLEIGSGPTNPTTTRLAKLGELHGIDPGSSVLENTALTEAKVFDGVKFPYPDNSFDACFSTYVMEHVKEADDHMAEVHRVLKPGGLYIFRGANVFHYVTMTARLTPFWFHKIANWLPQRAGGLRGPLPDLVPPEHRRAGPESLGARRARDPEPRVHREGALVRDDLPSSLLGASWPTSAS